MYRVFGQIEIVIYMVLGIITLLIVDIFLREGERCLGTNQKAWDRANYNTNKWSNYQSDHIQISNNLE